MDDSDATERGEQHLGRVIAVSASQAIVLLERPDAARSAGALPLELSMAWLPDSGFHCQVWSLPTRI